MLQAQIKNNIKRKYNVYKLSILISLFIQAYRYAAEPFFFAQAKNVDAKKMYSKLFSGGYMSLLHQKIKAVL